MPPIPSDHPAAAQERDTEIMRVPPRAPAPAARPFGGLPPGITPPAPDAAPERVDFAEAERQRLALFERELLQRSEQIALAERLFHEKAKAASAAPAASSQPGAPPRGAFDLEVPRKREEPQLFATAVPEYTGRFVTKHGIIHTGYDFERKGLGRIESPPGTILVSAELPKPDLQRALTLTGKHPDGADQICGLLELKQLLAAGSLTAEQRTAPTGPISPFAVQSDDDDDDDEPMPGPSAHALGAQPARPK